MANIILHQAPRQEERFVTGYASFDYALGDNMGNIGMPLRTFWEIAGPSGLGKTTFGLSLISRMAAKYGRDITFLDFEGQSHVTLNNVLDNSQFNGAFNYHSYAVETDDGGKKKKKEDDGEKKKVKEKKKEVKEKTSEEILSESIRAIKLERPAHFVMVDSIAGFSPTALLEGGLSDANMGKMAFITKQWAKQSVAALLTSSQPTVSIFINHLMPTFQKGPMPSADHTTGGRGKEYLSTHAIRLNKTYSKGYLDYDEGLLLEGSVHKNRDGYKKRGFYVFMVYGEGINYNLTAMFDCLMSAEELATKDSSGFINIDDRKLLRINDMIAQRFDNSLFEPFHNAIRATKLTQSQSADEET